MRLTAARTERWLVKLTRSERELAAMVGEMQGVKLAAKGGRLSHMTTLLAQTRDALSQVRVAQREVEALQGHEARKAG